MYDMLEAPENIFNFDEEAFSIWTEGAVGPHVDGLRILLMRLFDLINCRLMKTIRWSLLVDLARILAVHGIPFLYARSAKNGLKRTEFNYKYFPTKNIEKFFTDLSLFEYNIRLAIWTFRTLEMNSIESISVLKARTRSRSNAPYALRYQLCMASRHRNYRSILGHLAYSPLIRNITEVIDDPKSGWKKVRYCQQRHIFFDSPIVMNMALHAVLNMPHDSLYDMGTRIQKLATMQSLIYTTYAAQNSIMSQLTEFLTSTIALKFLDNAKFIASIENNIHRKNKKSEYLQVWNAYKMLMQYENWKTEGMLHGMVLGSAESLSETVNFLGIYATVFVETACRIWAKLGRNENKVSNLLSSFVRSYPQLVNRVVKFLEEINMPHERELIVHDACTPDSTLSPSDPIWIEWCEPRIQHPERFGIREEILARCADVLFNFLDYGCNRKSPRAWILLHTVVQFIDKSRCELMWRDRADWWPRFHIVILEPFVECCRKEIIDALMELSPL